MFPYPQEEIHPLISAQIEALLLQTHLYKVQPPPMLDYIYEKCKHHKNMLISPILF